MELLQFLFISGFNYRACVLLAINGTTEVGRLDWKVVDRLIEVITRPGIQFVVLR